MKEHRDGRSIDEGTGGDGRGGDKGGNDEGVFVCSLRGGCRSLDVVLSSASGMEGLGRGGAAIPRGWRSAAQRLKSSREKAKKSAAEAHSEIQIRERIRSLGESNRPSNNPCLLPSCCVPVNSLWHHPQLPVRGVGYNMETLSKYPI